MTLQVLSIHGEQLAYMYEVPTAPAAGARININNVDWHVARVFWAIDNATNTHEARLRCILEVEPPEPPDRRWATPAPHIAKMKENLTDATKRKNRS